MTQKLIHEEGLTLPTNGAEPSLGLALPPSIGSRDHGGYRGRQSRGALSGLFACGSTSGGLILRLSLTFFGARRGGDWRLVLYNLTTCTKFYHVNGTFTAGDKVAAGKQYDFTRSRKAEKTLRRRLVFLRCGWRAGRRIGRGNRGLWSSRVGCRARQTIDFVKVECVGTDLSHQTQDEHNGNSACDSR